MISKIKETLLVMLLGISPFICAEFAYDAKTDKVYSKNAPKKVNQEEFNFLFWEMLQPYRPRGYVQLTLQEYAAIFAILRLCGTPAAVRLIEDLELLIKTAQKDIKRLSKE